MINVTLGVGVGLLGALVVIGWALLKELQRLYLLIHVQIEQRPASPLPDGTMMLIGQMPDIGPWREHAPRLDDTDKQVN